MAEPPRFNLASIKLFWNLQGPLHLRNALGRVWSSDMEVKIGYNMSLLTNNSSVTFTLATLVTRVVAYAT